MAEKQDNLNTFLDSDKIISFFVTNKECPKIGITVLKTFESTTNLAGVIAFSSVQDAESVSP